MAHPPSLHVSPFALVTLSQVNTFMNFSGSGVSLNTFLRNEIDRVSDEIETQTRRRFMAREYREFYDGSGNSTLWLNNYPILGVSTVEDDVDRDFDGGADTLIKKSSLLFPENGEMGAIRVWDEKGRFQRANQNIRIYYYAGYAGVDIRWSDENVLRFTERSGGTSYQVKVPANKYNVVSLASRVELSMNSLGLNSYQFRYDFTNRTYNVSVSSPVSSQTLNIANSTLLTTFGFGATSLSGATRYAPATPVVGYIPRDIQQVALDIIAIRYDQSGHGQRLRGVKQRQIADFSMTFFGTPILPHTQRTIDSYTKQMIY